MSIDIMEQTTTPLDQQIKNWGELNVTPYNKQTVHPYTRTRVILMNGIEVESAIFLHQFARHCNDPDLKRTLAMVRRIEQQQQKMVNWQIPGDESPLEVTLGYEQVAVDLTAWLARTEPNDYVRAALEFALIEDFDHLYRYANLMEATSDNKPERIVGDLTEIFPGRPTLNEHVHPFDTIRGHYDAGSADILTKLHVQTIIAAEQQTMNFYMNIGPSRADALGRGLYLEIAQIEEQHVSHYETLADPNMSWFDRWVLHEYNECYMYHSCATSETEPTIKKMWERHFDMEREHLRMAIEMTKHYEGHDPTDLLPEHFPELTIFQSNKDYIREVIANQVNLTQRDTDFVPFDQRPDRYDMYQKAVNDGGGIAPSHEVIQRRIDQAGEDYRLETEGQHPVEGMQGRNRDATLPA